MPEVILTGAAGRLEGRYAPAKTENAPIALILHPHPKAGGHMNNPVAVQLYHLIMKRGFASSPPAAGHSDPDVRITGRTGRFCLSQATSDRPSIAPGML